MLDHDPKRLAYYHDTTLLGWVAVFDRNLPFAAFRSYGRFYPIDWEFRTSLGAETAAQRAMEAEVGPLSEPAFELLLEVELAHERTAPTTSGCLHRAAVL